MKNKPNQRGQADKFPRCSFVLNRAQVVNATQNPPLNAATLRPGQNIVILGIIE